MHTVQASRRKGVGTAMLLHIVEAARAMGLSRLNLKQVPGRTFYLPVTFINATGSMSARRSGNTYRIQTVSSCRLLIFVKKAKANELRSGFPASGTPGEPLCRLRTTHC